MDSEMEFKNGIMNKRNIRNYFCREHKIQDEKTLDRLADMSFVKKIKRRDILVKQGEIPVYLLFQTRGIIGGFYVDEKGRYHMESFSGQYKLPISAVYCPEETSPVTLEALTKGEVIAVPRGQFLDLLEESPELMKVTGRMLLKAMRLQTEMKRVLLHYDVKQRYEWFMKEYPEVAGKISNRYVASFLNMTPETLSRVRKEMQEEKDPEKCGRIT